MQQMRTCDRRRNDTRIHGNNCILQHNLQQIHGLVIKNLTTQTMVGDLPGLAHSPRIVCALSAHNKFDAPSISYCNVRATTQHPPKACAETHATTTSQLVCEKHHSMENDTRAVWCKHCKHARAHSQEYFILHAYCAHS